MSGHSKWANIRVKKTAQDAKRGKVFTRHARLVEMAARGGSDPKTNSSLRAAIDNARVESVPNDNIERAIKKGSGELKGEAMQEVLYAAYLPAEALARAGGPGSIACLIECLTDNRKRTTANLKGIIARHGGSFAETGSVAWMFERKGAVAATGEKWKMENGKSEEMELELIDLGAEDVTVDDGAVHVVTSANDWTRVRDFLKQKDFHILSAGLSYVPKHKTYIMDQSSADKLNQFVEAIEKDDDVSAVHANAEITLQ